jgi:hypothetical protein
MHYVGHRHSLANTSPLRSLPLYRIVESVFGPSLQVCAEAKLRNARTAFVAEMRAYIAARAALGKANRRPVNWANSGAGCRRYHQAEAMRALNAHWAFVRRAERHLEAAQASIATLTPADAYAIPYLAELATRAAA